MQKSYVLSRICKASLLTILVTQVLFANPKSPVRAAPESSNSLVISQFQVSGTGTNGEADEFIEIHNISSISVNVDSYKLVYRTSSGLTDQILASMPDVNLPPGGYFLFANPFRYDEPNSADMSFIGANLNGLLSAAGGGIGIRSADNMLVDSVGYGSASNGFTEGRGILRPNDDYGQARLLNGCQDTNDNKADFVEKPSAPRNHDSPTHSCGPDNPPEIISTIPEKDAANVSLSASLVINFSEPAQAAPGWFSILCSRSGLHPATEATSDQIQYHVDPFQDFTYGDTCTATIDHTKITELEHLGEVMQSDYLWAFYVVPNACGEPFTATHDIQGVGSTSPVNGMARTVEGVVTGDFQAANGLGGFFLQAELSEYDADPLTSEGIFVYNTAFEVAPGDRVRVSGTVNEYNELTELKDVTNLDVCSSGNSIEATSLHLPLPEDQTLEPYEGMFVAIPDSLTVSQNYFLGRYGQVTLSAEGRMYTPTNGQADTYEYNYHRSIILDDGSSQQNPTTTPYTAADGTLRQGDTLPAGLTGFLDQYTTSGPTSYRLQPLDKAVISFTRGNPRTAAPDSTGGNLIVAGFNIHNYFTTLGSRGARNVEELERQTTKLTAALKAIDADIYALTEVENNETTAAQYLVDQLNQAYGAAETYALVADPPNGVGSDAIKNVLIYKPSRVRLVGSSVSPDGSLGPYAVFKRLPVAQVFEFEGENFTVMANHFKSRGCTGDETSLDADLGDGQGCYNGTRIQEAEALLSFIDEIHTATSDPDVLVLGDLNAYGAEDPINTLVNSGLQNEVAARLALPDQYSYTFDGMSGYLDHALASESLEGLVRGVDIWHINADEPNALNFDTQYNDPSLYQPDEYRSSDHDPVVVGLSMIGVHDLRISTAENEKEGLTGAEVTYNLSISNLGNHLDTYNISLAGNQWQAQASLTDVTLDKVETGELSVRVSIPPGAIPGDQDTVTVTVSSQGDPSKTSTLAFTTSVPIHYDLTLTTEQANLAADPGKSVTHSVRVKNTGNVPQNILFSIEKNTWETSPISALSLEPGETRDIAVKVTIPQGAVFGESDTLEVKAVSQQQPTVIKTITLTTAVAERHALAVIMQADKKSAFPGQTVEYLVALTNNGNNTETFTLELSNSQWAKVNPASIQMAPGENGVITVLVTIPMSVSAGEQDSARLTISSFDGLLTPETFDFITTVQYRTYFLPQISK